MSDATKKKNQTEFSQKFISYIEKNRIFELFQELSMMLLVKKPADHLLFMKQSLCAAARRLDAPRVVILAPPEFDKLQLARYLNEMLLIPILTLKEVLGKEHNVTLIVDPKKMINLLRIILIKHMRNNLVGWIFLDFPRTEQEARHLQRTGIFPSHVIDIVSPETIAALNNTDDCVTKNDYEKEIRGLRRVYSKLITTVNIHEKEMIDIAEECLNVIRRRKLSGPPTIFRVLLMDAIDAHRSKCLGRLLAEEYNVSAMDFNEIIERVSKQETDLGDDVRAALKNKFHPFPIGLKLQVFHDALVHSEGLKKGWILTGFINNVNDFKCLDMTDIPPNRVIIIVPKSYQIKSVYESLPKKDDEEWVTVACLCAEKGDCVDNYPCIEASDVKEIIDYAGETMKIIKDHADIKVVKDKIDLYMMLPPPSVPPRQPCEPPEIRPEDIEFDPDAEPDKEILDCIREPEDQLTLV